jgi:5-methylcytosine-specific restriction endonuclease McrA
MHVRTKYGKSQLRKASWQRIRLAALRRDHFICRVCGVPTGKSGQVDHIKPRASHPELMYDLDNLQTLCERCHAKKTRQGE